MDLQLQGLLPDAILYNAVIGAYGKGGMSIKDMLLLVDVKRQGLHSSATTYTAVISACRKGGLAT